jgi:hypothetical protein
LLAIYEEQNSEIQAVSLQDNRIVTTAVSQSGAAGSNWSLRYYAPDPKGVELTFEIKPASSLKLKIIDISFGLPSLKDFSIKPRPDDVMPTPDGAFYQDATIVSRSFALD